MRCVASIRETAASIRPSGTAFLLIADLPDLLLRAYTGNSDASNYIPFVGHTPFQQLDSMIKRSVAVLIYDEVEVLDFAGPYEVFAVTSDLGGHMLFDVFTVAPFGRPIKAVNGLKVVPDYVLDNVPAVDIAVISGGAGSRRLMDDLSVQKWVHQCHAHSEVVLSICSGARILAKAGLLAGLRVTTHHEVIDHIRTLEPHAEVVPGARFIDTGKIVTTAGISAGIDGAFHVVERLVGGDVARRTATYMEYERPARAGADPGSAEAIGRNHPDEHLDITRRA